MSSIFLCNRSTSDKINNHETFANDRLCEDPDPGKRTQENYINYVSMVNIQRQRSKYVKINGIDELCVRSGGGV